MATNISIRQVKYLICSLATIFLSISTCFAWQGKVIHVADGDTITVMHDGKPEKIRLYGIDTPEKKQEFGKKAKAFTKRMLAGKIVDVEVKAKDRYGRTVAIIRSGGNNINAALVANGYAWVYRQYCREAFCDEWIRLETRAKNRKYGLWVNRNPMPPWEWRHGGGNVHKQSDSVKTRTITIMRNGYYHKGPQRQAHQVLTKRNNTPEEQQNSSGEYRGNYKTHVFHRPGCRYYSCSTCTVSFASPAAARSAGYRPCKVCRP